MWISTDALAAPVISPSLISSVIRPPIAESTAPVAPAGASTASNRFTINTSVSISVTSPSTTVISNRTNSYFVILACTAFSHRPFNTACISGGSGS